MLPHREAPIHTNCDSSIHPRTHAHTRTHTRGANLQRLGDQWVGSSTSSGELELLTLSPRDKQVMNIHNEVSQAQTMRPLARTLESYPSLLPLYGAVVLVLAAQLVQIQVCTDTSLRMPSLCPALTPQRQAEPEPPPPPPFRSALNHSRNPGKLLLCLGLQKSSFRRER